jgi:hypothetical protein
MAKLLDAAWAGGPWHAIDPFHFGGQIASDQMIGSLVELGRVRKWKRDIGVNLSNVFVVSVNAVWKICQHAGPIFEGTNDDIYAIC